MTNHKAKETIKTIWERYARTLKLLDKALDELDKKPKEVIVEVEKPLPPTLEEIVLLNTFSASTLSPDTTASTNSLVIIFSFS